MGRASWEGCGEGCGEVPQDLPRALPRTPSHHPAEEAPAAPPHPGSDGADLPREVHPNLDVRDVHKGRILRICQEKPATVPKGPRIRKTGKVDENRVVGLKSRNLGNLVRIDDSAVLGRFRQPAASPARKVVK